jgi:NADH-quinone oxidoreductase subunit E
MTGNIDESINELISHYLIREKSTLLPILHKQGHVKLAKCGIMDKVAEILHILPIEVYEVVSFYTMYNQNHRKIHV